MRLFSGDGGETSYAALTDHGVADDVARRLQREMPAHGVVVVAGWTGDIADAARVMEKAGGELVRGEDGGVIGSPRLRRPADDAAPGQQQPTEFGLMRRSDANSIPVRRACSLPVEVRSAAGTDATIGGTTGSSQLP